MEKVYFIYVTENLINGKLYIGQHTCDYDKQFTDGYLGSGYAFKNALKKYGEENFRRIIIDYADSPEELNKLEAKYVTEEIYNDRTHFYNLRCGGSQHGFSDETRKKISKGLTGRKFSPETRKKLSESHKGFHPTDETRKKLSEAHKNPSPEIRMKMSKASKGRTSGMKGKHQSEEAKRKIGEASKGNKYRLGHRLSEEHKKKISSSLKGTKLTEEQKTKISETMKQIWKMRRELRANNELYA